MATAKQIAARKKFSEMAKSGKLAQLRKKAAKKNPANTVSAEVSAQMRKGKPQKQAVAIALEMNRQGKLKTNPIYSRDGFLKFRIFTTGAIAYDYKNNGDYVDTGFSVFQKKDKTEVYDRFTQKYVGMPKNRYSLASTSKRDEFLTDLISVTKIENSKDRAKRIELAVEEMFKYKNNPTPGQRTRSRTKLIQNGNGKRKSNPMQAYAIKCSRSGRTLGYADSLPMAKSMATAIANERMIPVQIVKA